MTFLHFANCALLSFGPSFIFYKAGKLYFSFPGIAITHVTYMNLVRSEYNVFVPIAYAALVYVVTQAIKVRFHLRVRSVTFRSLLIFQNLHPIAAAFVRYARAGVRGGSI
jgi:hypothetical protein